MRDGVPSALRSSAREDGQSERGPQPGVQVYAPSSAPPALAAVRGATENSSEIGLCQPSHFADHLLRSNPRGANACIPLRIAFVEALEDRRTLPSLEFERIDGRQAGVEQLAIVTHHYREGCGIGVEFRAEVRPQTQSSTCHSWQPQDDVGDGTSGFVPVPRNSFRRRLISFRRSDRKSL